MRRVMNPLFYGVILGLSLGGCTNVPAPEEGDPTVVTVTETEVVYVESDACIECVIEDVLSTYLEENFPEGGTAPGGPSADGQSSGEGEEGSADGGSSPGGDASSSTPDTQGPGQPEGDAAGSSDSGTSTPPGPGEVEELKIDLNINAVSLSGLATIGPIVSGGDVVLGVEFYVDGVRLDTDFIPPYSLVINTASYADGPHTITVYTADNTGQAANDQSVITFDNSPPEFTTTLPAEGAAVFYEDQPLTMELETDDINSMELVRFRASGFLVGEFFNPPFYVQKAWDEIYVFEDQLPATVNVRFFARDQLGLETEVSYNVEVHRRYAWQYENLGAIWAQALPFASGNIAYGTAYGDGGTAGRFVILNSKGEFVWEYDIGAGGALRNRMVYDEATDRIIATDLNGDFYAFNDNGGGVAWMVNADQAIASIVLSNSKIYSLTLQSVVNVRDVSNGSLLWSVGPLASTSFSRLAVDSNNEQAYFGTNDGTFFALNQSGLLWSKETGGSIAGEAAIAADGRVFVGSEDGFIYALDAQGNDLWKTDVGGMLHNEMYIEPESGDIFVQSGLKDLTRVEDETGDELWSVPIEGWQQGTGIEVGPDGTLYLAGALGGVYAVSPDDGTIYWSMDVANQSVDVVDEQFFAAPLVHNGMLYIGNENTYFYALNLVPPEAVATE